MTITPAQQQLMITLQQLQTARTQGWRPCRIKNLEARVRYWQREVENERAQQ
jgi:hypothetical protein